MDRNKTIATLQKNIRELKIRHPKRSEIFFGQNSRKGDMFSYPGRIPICFCTQGTGGDDHISENTNRGKIGRFLINGRIKNVDDDFPGDAIILKNNPLLLYGSSIL